MKKRKNGKKTKIKTPNAEYLQVFQVLGVTRAKQEKIHVLRVQLNLNSYFAINYNKSKY